MKFVREHWSDEAAAKLQRAMKYADDAHFIRAEVVSGRAALWNIDDGDAYMVTRGEGSECVIVCYEGSKIREAAIEIRNAARRGGFRFLRWHTQNPAINRALKFLNPEPVEYVMRCTTDGQQITQFDKREPDHDQHTRH